MSEKLFFDSNQQKDPFKTPEGYFDSFEDTLMKRIKTESGQASVKRLSIRKYLLAVAAIGTVLLGTFLWYLNAQKPVEETIEWADNQSIESYIEDNLDAFDEALLLEYSDNVVNLDWTEEEALTDELLIDILIDEVSIDDIEGLSF